MKNCAFAVIEVGLGGRLDATNIITPQCSVITNIQLDHAKIFGKTTALIAKEKAGIIKQGIFVVVGETSAKPLGEILKRAAEVCAPVILKNRDFRAVRIHKNVLGTHLKFYYKGKLIGEFSVKNLYGFYQVHNASCALAVLHVLMEKGLQVSSDSLRTGLYNTVWQGRFEKLSEEPFVIIDGAHNLAGSRVFFDTVKENILKDCIMILGILADKNIKKMMRNFCSLTRTFILSWSNSERVADMSVLEKHVCANGVIPSVYENVRDAVDYAWSLFVGKKAIVVTGSLYLIGEARSHILKKLGKIDELED